MPKSCAYGEVTREMVCGINMKLKELKEEISQEHQETRDKMTELFNHQSSRMPPWVTIVFTILGSLVTGLIILALK